MEKTGKIKDSFSNKRRTGAGPSHKTATPPAETKICPLCGRKFKPGQKVCVADLNDCQPLATACDCDGAQCDRFKRTAKTNQVYCPFCKYDADKLFDGYRRCGFKGQNNLNSRKLEQTRIYQSQHDRLSIIQSDEIDYGSGLDGDDQPYSMADLSDENFDETKKFKGRGSTLPEIKNSINNGGRFIRARETKKFKDIEKTFFVGPKSKAYEIKRAHPPENRKGKLKKGCVKKWKFKGPKEVYPPITRPGLEENEELGLYLPPPGGPESYRGRFLGDTSQASRESGEPGQDMKLFHHQGDSYFKYIYFSDTRPFFYLGLGHDNGKQFQGFLKLLKQGGEWGPCFINLREFKPIPRGRLVSVHDDPTWERKEPKGDKRHTWIKWLHNKSTGRGVKYEIVSHWRAFQPPETLRPDAADISPKLKDILKPRRQVREIDYACFGTETPHPTPRDGYDKDHKQVPMMDPPRYGTRHPFNYHFSPGLEYQEPKVEGFKGRWDKLPGVRVGGVHTKKGFKETRCTFYKPHTIPFYVDAEKIQWMDKWDKWLHKNYTPTTPRTWQPGPVTIDQRVMNGQVLRWYPRDNTTREGLSREWKTKRWRVRDWESLGGNS